MPRGTHVTKFQKVQAIAYRNDGKTTREIAGILKIGKSAIAEYLKNPDAHRKRKKLEDLFNFINHILYLLV